MEEGLFKRGCRCLFDGAIGACMGVGGREVVEDSGEVEETARVLLSPGWPLLLAGAVVLLVAELLWREICEAAAIYKQHGSVWDV